MSRIVGIGFVALFIATACTGGGPSQTRKIRIGVASFQHETCTFCPDPTGIPEWEYYGPPARGEAVLEMSPYIQGFTAAAREYEGVQLVGILSPRDSKGGSSGSWITREAFDKYAGGIADDLSKFGPFDGVYLSLHGAMAVSGIPKPEAELVRRVRKVVGDIPIFVTLDLHANEDQELAEAADGVLIVKRYPHYDSALQGERALRLLLRTIRGTFKPRMASRKPGVLTPSVFQGTDTSPAMEIMERARIWEERSADTYVSVAFGFAYADVPDIGATVMVMTNNDRTLAEKIAQDMSDYIWRRRQDFAGRKLPGVRAGVAQVLEAVRKGNTPVVVADHSDRTGNATHILEELVHQRARNFCVATLTDETAIREIQSKAKSGDVVSLAVGGYQDRFAGRPVPITGTIEYLGPYPPHQLVAVLRFGDNNRIILTPALHQVTDPGIFRDLGVKMEDLNIIVLKSRVHFRRGFVEDGLAKAVVVVDAPGLGPADVTTVPYENAPRELYPLTAR